MRTLEELEASEDVDVWGIHPKDALSMYYSGAEYPVHQGVYFLFFGGELQYVGKSKNIIARIAGHHSDKEKSFDWVKFLKLDTEAERVIAEVDYIMHYKPPFNKNFGQSRQYHSSKDMVVKQAQAKKALVRKLSRDLSEELREVMNGDISLEQLMIKMEGIKSRLKQMNDNRYRKGESQVNLWEISISFSNEEVNESA